MDEETILLVDDNPANLSVLTTMLEQYGYTVLIARNGLSAIEMADYAQPSIILLDVMMPGINGYETCRKLKANPSTQDIPVIFMTALNSTNNKVMGFEAGAVDYITKPVQHEEVMARVSTHVKLQAQTKELAELNASKDKFLSILSHDLRAPFNSLLTLSQLLYMGIGTKTEEDTRQMAGRIYNSAKNTYNLLQNLLTWTMMHNGLLTFSSEVFNLYDAIENIISLWDEVASEKGVQLENQIDPRLEVLADKNMLEMVSRNLVSNGIKFTPSGGTVCVNAELVDQLPMSRSADSKPTKWIKIKVADSGVGICQRDLDKILQTNLHHSTAGTNDETGVGLGLLLCLEMLEKQGGGLHIESKVDEGTAVWFLVPAADK